MSLRVERFPEYGVTLCVYSGVFTVEDLREHWSALTPEDVIRRISYADATADASRIDMGAFPELKRHFAARLKALLAGKRGLSAFVSDGKTGRLGPDFWTSYLGQDSSVPVQVAPFESLEAACAWLGVPEAGCRAVIAAAMGGAPRPATTGSAFAGEHRVR